MNETLAQRRNGIAAQLPEPGECLTANEWKQLVYLKAKAEEALPHLQRMQEYQMALDAFNSCKADVFARHHLTDADEITDGRIVRHDEPLTFTQRDE